MKICRLCSSKYEVLPAHSRLLQKLSPVFKGQKYLIPEPSLCPLCRRRRRLCFRNDYSLYRRSSSHSGKPILSLYPQEAPFPVYDHHEFWSAAWDPLTFGRDYDFSKSFFDQFYELQQVVPRIGLFIDNLCENCDYCNQLTMSRDCYLVNSCTTGNKCLYGYQIHYSTDCMDCLFCVKSELCYECIDLTECYNCRFSQSISNCTDCTFCYDLQSCSNCIFCCGLRSKSYCIENRQVTKQEYQEFLKALNTGSRIQLAEYWKRYSSILKDYPRRAAALKLTENVTGHNVQQAKNCTFAFDSGNLEDVHFADFIQNTRDSMDINYCCDNTELHYECCNSGVEAYNILFGLDTWPNVHNLLYCDSCSNGIHDCFGCIGVRGKSFCILNKQYQEDEYYSLVQRIISAMQSTGEWGEFFPPQMSPLGYNESTACDFYPLDQETAISRGYNWKVEAAAEEDFSAVTVLDNIEDIPDSFVNKTLVCAESGKPFRIVTAELEKLRFFKAPVPTTRFLSRHRSRVNRRPPHWLWKRRCSVCEKEVDSPYEPGQELIVYCQQCHEKYLYC